MIMKEQMKNTKASNLILGAIYINATTGTPCRLVHIVSCQGVWLEAFDGQGYGDLVKFEDCHYADMDEVEDYLADARVYDASNKAPVFKDDSPAIYPSDKGYNTLGGVIVERGFVAEDDVTYVGCDTVTGPDGNDYPIKDYS